MISAHIPIARASLAPRAAKLTRLYLQLDSSLAGALPASDLAAVIRLLAASAAAKPAALKAALLASDTLGAGAGAGSASSAAVLGESDVSATRAALARAADDFEAGVAAALHQLEARGGRRVDLTTFVVTALRTSVGCADDVFALGVMRAGRMAEERQAAQALVHETEEAIERKRAEANERAGAAAGVGAGAGVGASYESYQDGDDDDGDGDGDQYQDQEQEQEQEQEPEQDESGVAFGVNRDNDDDENGEQNQEQEPEDQQEQEQEQELEQEAPYADFAQSGDNGDGNEDADAEQQQNPDDEQWSAPAEGDAFGGDAGLEDAAGLVAGDENEHEPAAAVGDDDEEEEQ